MFYNPDKFDAVIVVFKFLTVFSSGLLSGEALYLSRSPCKCLLAMLNVEKMSLRVLGFTETGTTLYLVRIRCSSRIVHLISRC